MRATVRLCGSLRPRLTLFTRRNCSLCDTAKAIVYDMVRLERNFQYIEIDVMGAGQTKWKELYEFDAPVVYTKLVMTSLCVNELQLHIQSDHNSITSSTQPIVGVQRLFHRFTKEEVLSAMDKVDPSQK